MSALVKKKVLTKIMFIFYNNIVSSDVKENQFHGSRYSTHFYDLIVRHTYTCTCFFIIFCFITKPLNKVAKDVKIDSVDIYE